MFFFLQNTYIKSFYKQYFKGSQFIVQYVKQYSLLLCIKFYLYFVSLNLCTYLQSGTETKSHQTLDVICMQTFCFQRT